MTIEFEQEYLRELYEEGKVSGKKHRFQPQVIKQYIKYIWKPENTYLLRQHIPEVF